MNVDERIREQAARFPDRAALVEGRGRRRRDLSFAEFNERTARGAAFLKHAGHQAGDRVLFCHPVSIDLYVGLLAVMRAGLTAMFTDPGQGRSFLEASVVDHPPCALLGGIKARFARFLSPALRRIPRRYGLNNLTKENGILSPGRDPIPEDTAAMITFTSGSTGRPKGIVRTHRFLGSQHRALEKTLDLKEGEVDLVTLPMFVLANLASGVTSVLADMDFARPASTDGAAVCRQARACGVTRASASPAFFESVLSSGTPAPDLNKVFVGGAPVSPQLLETLRNLLPGAAITAVYGSSEAEPIAVLDQRTVTPHDVRRMREGAGLLAGEPVPEIRCALIPEDGSSPDLDRNSGKCGEIVVAGEHVLDHYLDARDEEDRKLHFHGGTWHRTGDAGYFDEHGRLWLLGRCEAAFTDPAGERRYPLEVETPANSLPEVRRSAALLHHGVPSLFVELKREARPSRELSKAIFARLPRRAITEVRFTNQIPVDRRHNAKIDYVALKKILGP